MNSFWEGSFQPVILPEPAFRFTDQPSFFLAGSCFSQAMGEPLEALGCQVCANPLGPLYNPLSLARLFQLAARGEDFSPDFFYHQGLWRHPDGSTRLAHPDRFQAEHLWEQALAQAGDFLRRAEVLVLTFGTPDHWVDRVDGRLWANCHKLPQGRFERKTASVSQMVQALRAALAPWFQQNPRLKLILTLSPVRYPKPDGAAASLGKALLRIVCQELKDAGPWPTDYFPSAEILLDELRDYRWYGPDRLHPSDEASLYIAQRFWKHYSPRPQDWERSLAQVKRNQHRPRFAP